MPSAMGRVPIGSSTLTARSKPSHVKTKSGFNNSAKTEIQNEESCKNNVIICGSAGHACVDVHWGSSADQKYLLACRSEILVGL